MPNWKHGYSNSCPTTAGVAWEGSRYRHDTAWEGTDKGAGSVDSREIAGSMSVDVALVGDLVNDAGTSKVVGSGRRTVNGLDDVKEVVDCTTGDAWEDGSVVSTEESRPNGFCVEFLGYESGLFRG